MWPCRSVYAVLWLYAANLFSAVVLNSTEFIRSSYFIYLGMYRYLYCHYWEVSEKVFLRTQNTEDVAWNPDRSCQNTTPGCSSSSLGVHYRSDCGVPTSRSRGESIVDVTPRVRVRASRGKVKYTWKWISGRGNTFSLSEDIRALI